MFKAERVRPSGRRMPVALKVLEPRRYLQVGADPEVILRTWEEQCAVLNDFAHRGFARAERAFQASAAPDDSAGSIASLIGNPAFALEWLDGDDLGKWASSRRDLDLRERLCVLRNAASGLDAFHARTEYAHRDLKPSNVMVVDGSSVVVDFGLIRSFDQRRQGSALAGTLGYLAPELFGGAEYSAATDLFAFAGLVYFLAVGASPPHPIPRQLETVRDSLERAGLRKGLDVLTLSLHHEVSRRPQLTGAQELLAAVANASPLRQHAEVDVPDTHVAQTLQPTHVQPPARVEHNGLVEREILGRALFLLGLTVPIALAGILIVYLYSH